MVLNRARTIDNKVKMISITDRREVVLVKASECTDLFSGKLILSNLTEASGKLMEMIKYLKAILARRPQRHPRQNHWELRTASSTQ